MRGHTASASLFARRPQVHNKSNRERVWRCLIPYHLCLWGCVKISGIKTGPPNCHINVVSSSLVWVAMFYFNRVHMHHTEKRMCCFIVWWALMKQLWQTLEGLTNPRTWASEHTHIISEALSNSDKWLQMNWSCKSHQCTLSGLHTLPQLGCLPSDVCGCLTSPARVHVSLWKDHYWCTLIQTVIICASCVAPYPLSLWCHCLCHKSHWAEHPMLQAFMWTKQISLYCFCESASTIPLFFFLIHF